ncbi:MAG: hypothetical protein ACREVE_08980 [Gammaproteobacteria bacterium]
MRTRIVAALLALLAPGVCWTVEPTAKQLREGIWKSPPPPDKAQAQFGAQDPYGLTFGTRIAVDCSIYWISTETGHLYCFNSLTSKAYFMGNPERYIRGARAFLARDKHADSAEPR